MGYCAAVQEIAKSVFVHYCTPGAKKRVWWVRRVAGRVEGQQMAHSTTAVLTLEFLAEDCHSVEEAIIEERGKQSLYVRIYIPIIV